MNISELYNGIIELGKIYQKLDNIEIQKKIIELSEKALEMQSQILSLQKENSNLKMKEEISSKIKRHKDAYVTLKDDDRELIYCANCWDTNKMLVQGQVDDDGTYYCSVCKEEKFYDRDLYRRKYSDDLYNNNII